MISGVAKLASPDGYGIEVWERALAGMGRACCESGLASLIPKGHAGIVVFALVPAGAFVIGTLVGRNPAEMFKGHFDARVKHDGIVNMPAIGASMAADDAPLIEE